jgi:PKD repeat protein
VRKILKLIYLQKFLKNGTYKLSFENLDFFPQNICISLEDRVTGNSYDLREDSVLTASFNSNYTNARFILRFTRTYDYEVIHENCFGLHDGEIELFVNDDWNIEWKNAMDDFLGSDKKIKNLKPGEYFVEGYNPFTEVCGSISTSFVVESGYKVTANFFTNDKTYKTDEQIEFVNQSVNADDFWWDFGDGSVSQDANPIKSYSQSGEYEVKLVSSSQEQGCSDEYTSVITIEEPLSAREISPLDYRLYNMESHYLLELQMEGINHIQLDLYNSLGQKLIGVSGSGKDTYTIPKDNLAQGVYFIHLSDKKSGNLVRTIKVNK